MGFAGLHIISKVDLSSKEAQSLDKKLGSFAQSRMELIKDHVLGLIDNRELGKLLHKHWEEYKYHLAILNKNFLLEQKVIHNITATVGRSVLMQRLAGTTTYTGTANYCALGDDNTAPSVGDTTLNNETYRKATSSATFLSNVAYLETYLTQTEVTGSFEEFGYFIDGGAGVDSGQLFNHFLYSITKSAVEGLNVQSIITANDA